MFYYKSNLFKLWLRQKRIKERFFNLAFYYIKLLNKIVLLSATWKGVKNIFNVVIKWIKQITKVI